MAVKIKLTRLGKIRNPQYRIASPTPAPAGRLFDRGHRPLPPLGKS